MYDANEFFNNCHTNEMKKSTLLSSTFFTTFRSQPLDAVIRLWSQSTACSEVCSENRISMIGNFGELVLSTSLS